MRAWQMHYIKEQKSHAANDLTRNGAIAQFDDLGFQEVLDVGCGRWACFFWLLAKIVPLASGIWK